MLSVFSLSITGLGTINECMCCPSSFSRSQGWVRSTSVYVVRLQSLGHRAGYDLRVYVLSVFILSVTGLGTINECICCPSSVSRSQGWVRSTSVCVVRLQSLGHRAGYDLRVYMLSVFILSVTGLGTINECICCPSSVSRSQGWVRSTSVCVVRLQSLGHRAGYDQRVYVLSVFSLSVTGLGTINECICCPSSVSRSQGWVRSTSVCVVRLQSLGHRAGYDQRVYMLSVFSLSVTGLGTINECICCPSSVSRSQGWVRSTSVYVVRLQSLGHRAGYDQRVYMLSVFSLSVTGLGTINECICCPSSVSRSQGWVRSTSVYVVRLQSLGHRAGYDQRVYMLSVFSLSVTGLGTINECMCCPSSVSRSQGWVRSTSVYVVRLQSLGHRAGYDQRVYMLSVFSLTVTGLGTQILHCDIISRKQADLSDLKRKFCLQHQP